MDLVNVIEWCEAHHSPVDGDQEICQAAEAQMAPYDWPSPCQVATRLLVALPEGAELWAERRCAIHRDMNCIGGTRVLVWPRRERMPGY